MSPMKVCMLTTGFPRFKGDLFGSFILELTKRLVNQNVKVEVIAPHEEGLPRKEEMEGVIVQRFRYLLPTSWQRVAYGGGIPTNISKSWVARFQVVFFLFGFWLKALGEIRNCDLVHCHWTISGLVAYCATRLWRRPIVLSVRGSDIHLLEGGMMRWINGKIYEWMDVVVAVSEDIGEKLAGIGVEREKIRVVYNGVDEPFQPGDKKRAREGLGLPHNRFTVLFVGLLVPIKGLEVLLEAVHQVDDERLLCILVGDGTLRECLEKQANETGLEGQVLFAGSRSSQEIPVWMNAADLLVLPSFSEGRPNVVLEAQACGLPVLATRVGGTPELVTDGSDGLLVDSGDTRQLADGIITLMSDESYRRQLGRGGRESIQKRGLTWEASALRIKEIYQEVRCQYSRR